MRWPLHSNSLVPTTAQYPQAPWKDSESTAVWRDILALFLDSAAGFGGGFREVWPQVINKTSPSRAVYWPRCCSRGPAPKRLLDRRAGRRPRSEEHTSELQSLMRISYAVFRL